MSISECNTCCHYIDTDEEEFELINGTEFTCEICMEKRDEERDHIMGQNKEE